MRIEKALHLENDPSHFSCVVLSLQYKCNVQAQRGHSIAASAGVKRPSRVAFGVDTDGAKKAASSGLPFEPAEQSTESTTFSNNNLFPPQRSKQQMKWLLGIYTYIIS